MDATIRKIANAPVRTAIYWAYSGSQVEGRQIETLHDGSDVHRGDDGICRQVEGLPTVWDGKEVACCVSEIEPPEVPA